MKFVEMTGRTLAEIIAEDELHAASLEDAGVGEDTLVRINEQGDIEIRRPKQWDLVGGLLGDYVERVRRISGLEWV